MKPNKNIEGTEILNHVKSLFVKSNKFESKFYGKCVFDEKSGFNLSCLTNPKNEEIFMRSEKVRSCPRFGFGDTWLGNRVNNGFGEQTLFSSYRYYVDVSRSYPDNEVSDCRDWKVLS